MDTSYLAQQVTTIIGQLHGLFDDIGVPSHERDSREAEVRWQDSLAWESLTISSSSLRCRRRCTTS
jgi:hypothetical protein